MYRKDLVDVVQDQQQEEIHKNPSKLRKDDIASFLRSIFKSILLFLVHFFPCSQLRKLKPLGQNGAFGTAFTVYFLMIFNKLSREAPNPDTESHEPITMCMKVFNIHGNKRFDELTRIQRELTNLTILKNEEQILHVL